MSYKKLVRDKIPEIIKQNGDSPITRILDNEEYTKELNKKLLEECNEYLASEDVEEIADILEVIRAIIKAKGHTPEEIEEIRKQKAQKRGGFDKQIYLEGIEENEK